MKIYKSILVLLFPLALVFGQLCLDNASEPPKNSYEWQPSQYMQGNTARSYNEPVVVKEMLRMTTAYNAILSQTDSTPCISASGLNVCETGRNIVATNEFPFGTLIEIDGVIYEVQDRMNSRYLYEVDILMEDYNDAKTWGRQEKIIKVLVN